jgi:diketogulonate reductase-like aldo/keto reductase
MAKVAGFLLGVLALAAAQVVKPDVEIAPGVLMPMVSLGGVESRPSNYSAWLSPAVGGAALDTALDYGTATQSAVGAAVRASGLPRAKVFITTKVPCCPFTWATPNQTACADPSFANVTLALERDLAELGLAGHGGQADLVLLHWPCDSMEQSIAAYRALEAFHAAGKARAIGVSNFNSSQLAALLAVAKVPPAVNQCEFSIGVKNPLCGKDGPAFAAAHGVTYEAYSPLGGLSGIDVLADPDVRRIAAAHGVAAAQVALRWVVQQGIAFATAAQNPAYMVEDLDLFSFELSDAEMATLAAK